MKSSKSCPQCLIASRDVSKAKVKSKTKSPSNKIQNQQQIIIKYSKEAGKSQNIQKINTVLFEEHITKTSSDDPDISNEYIEKAKQVKYLLCKYHDIEFEIAPKNKLRYYQETDSQQTLGSERENFRFEAKSKLSNLLARTYSENSQYSSLTEVLGLYIIQMQLGRRRDSYAFVIAIQNLIKENSSVKKTALLINYFEQIFQLQEIRLKPHNFTNFCAKHFQFFENQLEQAYVQEYFEKATMFQKLFKLTFSIIQRVLKVPTFERIEKQVFRIFCCILGNKQFQVRQICALPFAIVILSASLSKLEQFSVKDSTNVASAFLKVKPVFMNGVMQKVSKRLQQMKEQEQIK